jgi:hypothetical protein
MHQKQLISYKGARRYLKEKLKGDVEKEAVKHMQNLVQTSLDDFCDEAIKEHQHQNQMRQAIGLKEKKRFSEDLFKKVSPGFISCGSLSNIGVEGQHDSETSISGSYNMENKSSSKKATICDGLEVQ